ncbi:MAG TPA: sulfatase, partial [Pseudomonadota bacterium]|nr:sulfatase [Pseudomonadota bacterium]
DSALRGRRPRNTSPQPELTAERDAFTPPPFAGPRLAGRDVFLITVDALRFDRVSAATMPFVASLLPRAAVFSRAYTQVPHTSFAIATLLTGKPVYALMTLGQDAGSHETLPLILRRFRYKTAAFYPPSVFYVEHERLRRLEESAYGFEYVKFEYLAAPQRTAQLMRFLQDEQPPRVFAWVHYLEPHEPYDSHPGGPDPSRPDRERYDGEVRFIDDELRRLCDYLRRTRPSALLILAADHGEEFGEHGGRYHGTSLYEEQVHVPLLIVDLANLEPVEREGTESAIAPALRLFAQQLDQPVGLIDVAPTVLGLLDIEPSVRMRGHDLSPWLLTRAGALPRWPVFSEIGRKKMVVRGDQKLICDFATDSCQAFALQRDPQELRSILESAPESAAELRLSLDRFIAEARRFEEAPAVTDRAAATAPAGERAAALSRGRMGDRGALPVLVGLVLDPAAPRAQQQSALAVVAQLAASVLPATDPAASSADPLLSEPPLADPAIRARLRGLFTAATRAAPVDLTELRWTAVVRLRLAPSGALLPQDATEDRAALEAVSTLIRDERADAEQRFAAALALFHLPQCQARRRAPAAPVPT